MDAKELRELIDLISRSNFSTFELEREGLRLRLVKEGPGAPTPGGGVAPAVHAETPPQNANPVGGAAAPAAAPRAAESGLVELASPIVGTFYRSPSPGAPFFVEVGDRVKKGQVLCIIEAMKLMNEIEAEIEAEVVEVAVQNGQPVEFGEVLFRLRPLA